MPSVERLEKPANLLSPPHIAPLKLRQGHMPVIDIVEDGRSLHEDTDKEVLGLEYVNQVGGMTSPFDCP